MRQAWLRKYFVAAVASPLFFVVGAGRTPMSTNQQWIRRFTFCVCRATKLLRYVWLCVCDPSMTTKASRVDSPAEVL
ncbi:hypothetical protein GGS21DRAFT_520293 [Xylaria nigripes]|nr:hypothetical protein GGS21DRAFT_520293 [Xylaria nigripes]